MDKQTILDKLIAAEPVAKLVLEHNYLPQGNSHVINELNEIHKKIFNKGVMLHCGSCISDMIKRLYIHVKPQLINELTPKEVEQPKTKKRGKA